MRNRPTLNSARWLGLVGLCAASIQANAQETPSALGDIGVMSPAIHATRLDYSEFESPEAVTVITQEDIRAAGYLEISEIFRSVPGFRIAKIGDESRVSYHGTTVIQNRRMLVTIDGRSILIGDGNYVEFDRLPIDLEDISRVTITRGPNGAAYGDNAFLASVDFKTIGRDDPHGASISAGRGYNGRRKIGGSLNEQVRGYDIAFSAAKEHDGGYDYLDSVGTPRDDGKDTKRARLAIEREFSQGSRWLLDSSVTNSEHKSGLRAFRYSGKQRNNTGFVALANERELGDSSRLDWSVSYNRQRDALRQHGCYTPEAIASALNAVPDPKLQVGLLAPTLFVPRLLGTSLENTCFFTDLERESERREAELEFESRKGSWRYLMGASATQIDASSAQYFAGQDQQQRSYRIFGETATMIGSVHASIGAMAQHSSNAANTALAWRGAVNWQLRPNQMLRYSYASSFRIPSLVETEAMWTSSYFFGRRNDPLSTYQFSLPLPLVTSTTRLEPETIESHALGYFGTFLRSSTTIDIKVFDDRIHNPVQAGKFYFSPLPFNSVPYSLRGVEMEVSLRLSNRWKIAGQYSYLDTDARTKFERGLYGDQAGSVSATFSPASGHAITLSYYGNSKISGNSYDRYDFVYNYDRTIASWMFRSQLIFHHHIGGVDGIRDSDPLLSEEGYFADTNQLFANVELIF